MSTTSKSAFETPLKGGTWCSSLLAAAAGCGVIDTLLRAHGVVVNLLPPEGFDEQPGRAGQRWRPQPQAGRAIILLDRALRLDHLRAIGFDPITFDGADPGAFAWASSSSRRGRRMLQLN